jgi:hypothetical protein
MGIGDWSSNQNGNGLYGKRHTTSEVESGFEGISASDRDELGS